MKQLFKRSFTVCVLLISMVCSLQVNAQKKNDEDGDVTNVTKITLFSPGLSYEARIGKFQTIHTHALMNLLFLSEQDPYADRTDTKVYFDPSVIVNYRYYYNY